MPDVNDARRITTHQWMRRDAACIIAAVGLLLRHYLKTLDRL
jgi:hypothetical protein